MPYNTTLSQLVDALKTEIGASTNSAQNINMLPQLQLTLRRTQIYLYNDFDWPHMRSYVDDNLALNERYYTFPNEVNFDKITKAEVYYTNQFRPLIYGIGGMQYNAYNSDLNVTNDPIVRWQHYQRNQYEVWPIPASNNQKIRFHCTLNLRPLIANSDQCDLDDTLIVLFAAAELLTKLDSKDAGAKQQLATAHYKTLRGNQTKQPPFVMGGGLRNQKNLPPHTDEWTLRPRTQ